MTTCRWNDGHHFFGDEAERYAREHLHSDEPRSDHG